MTLTSLSAQKSPKPIKLLGKSVQYVGVSTDKIPSGEGVLTIKNSDDSGEYIYTLSGEFSSTDVTNATFKMERQGVVFKGYVGYAVDKKLKNVVLTLTNGEFAIEDKSLISLVNDEQLVVSIPAKGAEISGVSQKDVEYDFKAKDIELAKRFVGDDKYSNYGGTVTLIASKENGLKLEGMDQITGGTMTFSNGATVSINKSRSEWKRANGDLIVVNNGKISSFTIAIAEGVISHNNIDYKFANGAKYVGSYKNLAPQTLEALIDLKSINWEFNDDVDDNIVSGSLTYANRSTITFRNSRMVNFVIYVKNGCVEIDSVEYTFPNGVKYIGGYDSDFMAIFTPVLLNPEEFVWPMEKFDDCITSGKLYLPNGGPVCDVKQGKPIELPDVIKVGDIKLTIRDPKKQFTYSLLEVKTADTDIYMSFVDWNPTLHEIMNLEECINYKWCLKHGKSGTVKLSNGTFFHIESYYSRPEIIGDYKIVFENGYISNNSISYTFANGNRYVGTTRGIVVTPQILIDFDSWKWKDFNHHVDTGVLTLADGTKKSYEFGIEKSKLTAQKQRWEQAKEKDVTRYYHNYYWGKRISYMRHTYLDLSYVEYNKDSREDYLYLYYSNGDRVILRMSVHSTLEQFRDDTNVLPPHINSFISSDITATMIYNDGLTIERAMLQAPTPLGYARYSIDYNKKGLTLKSLDYVKDGVTYRQKYIKFADGRLFDGEYTLQFDKNIDNPLNDDPRVKMHNITLNSSPEAIVGVEFYDGALFDAQGNVIEIYKSGKKLSKGETLSLESTYKKKRTRRETIDKFVAKGYKQNHVESVIDGNIPIGAPIKLLIEYHGSSKIKASGWYDDGHEYRSYKGLGRYIGVDSKGIIVEHIRAYY